MKICFDTFGCRLNRAEALEQEALFLSNGWVKTSMHHDADLIIVRGCSVTGRAQHDCEKFIAALKAKYPAKRIFTTGCLAQKTPSAMIDAALRSACGKNEFIPEATPVSTARAYLKAQDGCNGNCTFCIVPKFRGRSASVDFSTLIGKAKRFIDCGYSEIVLTGCNLSLYLSEGKRLCDLLAALADIDGNSHRVRIGSLEPGPAAMDTLHVMGERKNICRFLHIPIQSASNKVLAEMRRPYNVRDLNELASAAQSILPGAGMGCDTISGFPGESECDHEATMEFLQHHAFSNVHAFPYSERPGTPAASFSSQVEKSVRSMRAHAISSLVKSKRETFAKRFKGHTVEIAVEDAGTLSGWTSQYLWCSMRAPSAGVKPRTASSGGSRARKSLVKMLVKEVVGDKLFGEPV